MAQVERTSVTAYILATPGRIAQVAPHLGSVVCDQAIAHKLTEKHGLTFEFVRQQLEWPARPLLTWDDHPDHGRRLVAMCRFDDDRRLAAFLLPLPEWDEKSTSWVLKTAYWLR